MPNSDLAYHPLITQRYPLLASAILAGASAQLRNMASTGGNLLQRTRCAYFYDTTSPCNKREPGSGCSAIAGLNRGHAILGTSEACIATHPSDMCVALVALDATVHVVGPTGARAIAFADFHRLPGNTPQRDTNLERNEIIIAIELPARGFAMNCSYMKIRDRLSYAFALVSVAAALELEGDTIKAARTGAWRCRAQAMARPLSRSGVARAEHRLLDVHARCERLAARRQGIGAQRLQDRSCSQRHRPHADAGRIRHAAVAVQQENRLSRSEHDHDNLHRNCHVPHRWPCQGHWRREIRERILYSRVGACLRRRIDRHQGPHRTHRREPGAFRQRRDRRTHASKSATHGKCRQRLQGRCGSGRFTVSTALRRPDFVQRPAGRPRGRRRSGNCPLRSVTGPGGIRAGIARH